ncbi:RNA polymerase sigma factor [Lachnospiraceae bacterium 38-10]
MTVEEAVIKYGDMLFRICLIMLCSEQDAQDAVQDTFCRYMEHTAGFRDREHEKAWLIKVAANRCRDMHRNRSRHPEVQLTDVEEYCEFREQSEVLTELMNLPEKLKEVVYLHYIEGYKTMEISRMLGITPNAVRKRMQRGRESLRYSLYGGGETENFEDGSGLSEKGEE